MTTKTTVRRAFYEARPSEVRLAIAHAELRDATDSDGMALAGYASITGTPYEVTDWLGSYDETISRGAFGKALNENDDVRLLVNHDGVPLARTGSGTLSLREITNPLDDPQGRGQTGLWSQASLDAASPLAQTVRSAMTRGDMNQMSFAFQVTRQEWNEDYSERTVNELRLFDVSVVTYPANPATSVELNSERRARAAAHLRAGRPLDADDVETIRSLLAFVPDEIEERAEDADEDADAAEETALAAARLRILKLL